MIQDCKKWLLTLSGKFYRGRKTDAGEEEGAEDAGKARRENICSNGPELEQPVKAPTEKCKEEPRRARRS